MRKGDEFMNINTNADTIAAIKAVVAENPESPANIRIYVAGFG